jgi:Ala-tRNA(Pro) deacylase
MPATSLVKKLTAEHLPYELLPHRRTLTAAAEARALGVQPQEIAKTVILRAGEELVRAVIPASERVDLAKATHAFETEVELVHEDVLAGAYPDFELGAIPPLGGPPDRVLVDLRLCGCEWLVFEAGTHDESVRLRTDDLLEAADAAVADLCAR